MEHKKSYQHIMETIFFSSILLLYNYILLTYNIFEPSISINLLLKDKPDNNQEVKSDDTCCVSFFIIFTMCQ